MSPRMPLACPHPVSPRGRFRIRLRLLRSLDLQPRNWLHTMRSVRKSRIFPPPWGKISLNSPALRSLIYLAIFVIANFFASQRKLCIGLKITFVRFRRGRPPAARHGKPGHRSPFDLFLYQFTAYDRYK